MTIDGAKSLQEMGALCEWEIVDRQLVGQHGRRQPIFLACSVARHW